MKKNFYIILCLIFIVIIAIYGIYLFIPKNNKSLDLIDSSKDVVYTYYSSNDFDQQVPIINLSSLDSDINQEIVDFYNPYLEIPSVTTSYLYNINGKILSLLLVVGDYNNDHCIDYQYKTIHIDLETFNRVSDEEIINYFGYTQDEIVSYFDKMFHEYYEDEVSNGYLSAKLNYNSFLSIHEINDWNQIIYYYIDDGKLYAYIDYFEYPEQEKINYFKEIGYRFEL